MTTQKKTLATKDRIRALRRSRQWSTSALAERLGVSRRTIEDYEQGRCKPSRAVLMLLEMVEKGKI